MKRIIAGMLAIAVLAAPCAYDVFSPEPSPLAGLATMSAIFGKLQE
ncbi:hypothetical protein J4G37_30360 [Microvirga sp. 3-52]|nr:hypothetical protein [Microvirga sp. 3-52]